MRKIFGLLVVVPPGLIWIAILAMVGVIGREPAQLTLSVCALFWVGFGIGTLHDGIRRHPKLSGISFGQAILLLMKSLIYGPFSYKLLYNQKSP